MNITLDKSSTTEASLKIALTPEDYQAGVDKKIKEYSKQANLKGFRPGKVPASVIQRLYGKSILVDEVNETLSKAVNDYLRESKLLVVGDPMPDREKANAIDWDSQKEFEFVYNLGLASDFDVDFTKLPAITSYEIQAGDKEYNDTLVDLKKRMGEHAHVEEVTAAGDLVYGTFTQGEYSEKSAIPTDKLTEEAFAGFVGKKKGDVLTFDIQKLFADEKGLKLATGREDISGEFEFTIEDITRNQDSELNQEFFDKVLGPGKVSSEEEFKAQLLEIVQENYKRESEFLLRDEVQKTLLDNVQIELPNEFLKQWLIETNQGEITAEEVEKDFDKFARDLRWTLIRNKVAEAADIKVETEDVNTYAEAMVRQQFGIYGDDNGMGDVIKKVAQNYLQENKGQNYMNVFNRVYGGKTMDFILTQIQPNVEKIDVDTFKAKAGVTDAE
ncbi:trigger factor [Siphonobacter sp. BAB-5405]|uniref:trigger factor n=1 Tax=Siphonobacter sp. BAB-5405 TaxID=1864825 RepID=UPI000C809A76|nr:trigger factor [Siphonobacter sp. BAB-5405]PMD97579.1 trigger factor [Siphonobacter sp. BAB-5405]